MGRLFSVGIETLAAAFWLVPIFLILHLTVIHNLKRTCYYTLFALYLSAVYAVTGMPSIQYMRFDVNINLIPFVSMASELSSTLLNVLLFIPFGLLVPLIWKDFRSFKKMVLLGLSSTLFIELSQLLTYRATDINDLITNLIGTIIGYALARCFFKQIAPKNQSHDFYIITVIVLAVMFFLQQLSSEWLWLML